VSNSVDTVIALPFVLELTAVTFGALSGALHATRKGLDPVGVFTIALVCSVGGGLIRDVLLQTGRPVALVVPTYLASAAFASVVGVLFARAVRAAVPVMSVVDTLLIGVWVVLGAERALVVDLTYAGAAFLGVITATGGGLLRDLLCGEVPAAIRPGEWYVSAAVAAAVMFVLLVQTGVQLEYVEGLTILAAALLRAGSLRFGWRTPTAYDLWGDLETRMTARLVAVRTAADSRSRRRA
jgi:uncharacterized membrane protein YeiH